jgi:hypothetical protein
VDFFIEKNRGACLFIRELRVHRIGHFQTRHILLLSIPLYTLRLTVR